ncbi:glycosyltransferase family 2 protein [Chitinophaga sp. G-6-1-13]|uniref:Glycosyltransferase family 2 protein n=1 Tax=Chitinophaga fulva TaxID=2728842 RepID=A0A848GMT7_9BACT|nr:glycosyltransferase family A protein [Chitinophaga fulva]NML37268.1 glycosyltransferase family 2 protein [Chitinophaga fulva]
MTFTVVIPLYNKVHQIAATLQSVQQQVFTDYRVIIIDDGSTDGSLEIVQHYLARNTVFAERVLLVRQDNQGVAAARNKGIHLCETEWVAFLDADDLWKPEYLAIQYGLILKYPACNICGTGYEMKWSVTKIRPVKLNKLPFDSPDGLLDNYFEVAACSDPPLSSISVVIRKSALLGIGGFPMGVKVGEDLLTWARLALANYIAYSTSIAAVFLKDSHSFNADQQHRIPETEDVVGKELIALYQLHKDTPGLKKYAGLWYKMRTHIYLARGMRTHAIAEWRKSIAQYPFNGKTWFFLFLILFPFKVIK